MLHNPILLSICFNTEITFEEALDIYGETISKNIISMLGYSD